MINTTKPYFISYVDYKMGIVMKEKKDETEAGMVWYEVIEPYHFKVKTIGPFNMKSVKKVSLSDDAGENRTIIIITEDKNGLAPAHAKVMEDKERTVKEMEEKIEKLSYKVRSLERNKKETDSSDDVKRSKEMLRSQPKYANAGYDDPLDRFKRMDF